MSPPNVSVGTHNASDDFTRGSSEADISVKGHLCFTNSFGSSLQKTRPASVKPFNALNQGSDANAVCLRYFYLFLFSQGQL